MIDLPTGHRRAPRFLPTVFVSDVHLGCRYCHAGKFLEFLESHRIGHLYLVGDFIDGWRLYRKWRWPVVYHQICHRLLQMANEGTQLYYAPGNHDEFLRNYLRDFGFIDVANEFYYDAINGQRFLILHGDQFDKVEQSTPWLSTLGASAYETLMWLNHSMNVLRRVVSLRECHFSSRLKHSVKRAVKFISDFEDTVSEYAHGKGCDGVICGHIHTPGIRQNGNVIYCNTGDWVEHCTALVEYQDGTWKVESYLPVHQSQLGSAQNGEDFLQHVGRGTGARSKGGGNRREFTAST